jgi:hypothetical protein
VVEGISNGRPATGGNDAKGVAGEDAVSNAIVDEVFGMTGAS